MTDQIERHSDKLLREWEEIQGKEFWKLLTATWEKQLTQSIEFTLTTQGYDSILRSRGEVDGVRKTMKMAQKIADDIKLGKKG